MNRLWSPLTTFGDKPGVSSGKCARRKEFDLPILLVPGVEIVDTAWQNSQKIVSVIVEPNEPYALAGLEMVCLPENEFDQYVEMLKPHGWT